MDFRSTHSFMAVGEIYRDNYSIPAIITVNYPIFQAGYIRCKLLIKAQDWPLKDGNNLFGDVLDLKNPIQLKGTTESGQDIWASKLRLRSLRRASRNLLPSSDDQFILEGDVELRVSTILCKWSS